MALHLSKLRHLLDHYINLLEDFFDKIKFIHICFNHKRPKYQPDIIKIIFYYKIVKTGLYTNNKAYNNKS